MEKVFLLTLVVAVIMIGMAVAYSARVFYRERRRERRRIQRLHRYLAQ